jgi:caffeoyl-CoA O-methyltransferase
MSDHPVFDYASAVEYIESLLPKIPSLPVSKRELTGQRLQPTVGSLPAALLEVLVRSRQPRRILEIGTSFGYAACVLGRAAAEYGGTVLTFEINEILAKAARDNVAALKLMDSVDVRWADAREAVLTLDGPFGMILQDGGKSDYLPLLEPLVNLLEPGGLLISDDVLFPVMNLPASVDSWKKAIAEYNLALQVHPQLSTVWLPIGDGLALSVKRIVRGGLEQ